MTNKPLQLEVGLKAFAELLDRFRKRNIANTKANRSFLQQSTAELSERWDQQFPGFPKSWTSYFSYLGLSRRSPRNAHLKKIIIERLTSKEKIHKDGVVINPACFLGRRARYLASRLKSFKVIASDVNPRFNSFWRHLCKTPANYEFQKDSIFNPKLKVKPVAVVFFGACGSVTDAAMDYAIESNSPYIFCRTCCQYIIGGNTETAKDFNFVSWFWGLRKSTLLKIRNKKNGYYFSQKYSMKHYPRSQTAKGLTDSEEFLEISRYAAGSGICRTLIDVDRYLFLVEHRYNVWYQGEMFVAIKDEEAF